MAHTLRQRKQTINYADLGSPESNSDTSDSDYSSRSCSRQRKRRNLTLCCPTKKETKTANSSVNLTARHRRGHPSKNSALEVQNKETTDATNLNLSKKNGTMCTLSSNSITILSWLIECNVIKDGEHVIYSDDIKENPTKRGNIVRGRILCSCCMKEYSVWAFEEHCGRDFKQPYEHIYSLEKQKFLLEFIKTACDDDSERKHQEINSFKRTRNSKDKHDYACPICGDGGDLICCDKCLATYHLNCLNLKELPEGDWFCPYCVCKHCRLGDKSKQLIACFQCNKKFDWGCFKEFEKEALKETLDSDCLHLYCGQSCRKAYEKLEALVGVRNETKESCTWRVIHQMDRISTLSEHQLLENNAKVVITRKLMDEVFEPIVDRYSGLNVIQSVLYSMGSQLPRIDHSRFYTFILEKDDEVVSAASVRVHEQRFAEMPFMATHQNHRSKGYGAEILRVVELVLRLIDIQNLIIPSIPNQVSMWKDKFGFGELPIELKREITSYNNLMFIGSVLLCKHLTKRAAESDDSDRSLLDLNKSPPEETMRAEKDGATELVANAAD